MSFGYDEFESKLGQFIYTMVMYERLREYLLDKVKGRGRVSVRINLGQDKSGNHVFMDVILTSVKPEMLAPQSRDGEEKGKKTLVLVLSNEGIREDSRFVMEEMEKLIAESLRWWHSYFGERDKLQLNKWRIEKVSILDSDSTEILCEIPVNKIIIPQNRRVNIPSSILEKLATYVDLLGPITVRQTETGFYELIVGYPQLMIYVDKLGRDRVLARVLEVSEEEAERIYEDTAGRMNKLVNLLGTDH